MRVWMLAAALLVLGCDAPPGKVAAAGGSGGSNASAGSGSSAQKAAPAPSASAAPVAAAADVKLVLKNFDEVQALIASKKGKLVIVDAWSTYCEPCMKEFPGLVGLHKKYGPEKLACISLCTNYSGLGKPEEELEGPLEFLKKQGATFDNILSTDEDEKLYKKLKIASVPCIFVYDREGKLLKTFNNEVTYAVVEAFVAPLLK
ncbi:MAG: TlpA family protein disulfide reductase [Planctomycetia bacterium]|nr:TlpA family protein disulfide reductase [Planctomycetia bacterium]